MPHTSWRVSPFPYCLNVYVDTANSQGIWISIFFSEEIHATVHTKPRSNGNYWTKLLNACWTYFLITRYSCWKEECPLHREQFVCVATSQCPALCLWSLEEKFSYTLLNLLWQIVIFFQMVRFIYTVRVIQKGAGWYSESQWGAQLYCWKRFRDQMDRTKQTGMLPEPHYSVIISGATGTWLPALKQGPVGELTVVLHCTQCKSPALVALAPFSRWAGSDMTTCFLLLAPAFAFSAVLHVMQLLTATTHRLLRWLYVEQLGFTAKHKQPAVVLVEGHVPFIWSGITGGLYRFLRISIQGTSEMKKFIQRRNCEMREIKQKVQWDLNTPPVLFLHRFTLPTPPWSG